MNMLLFVELNVKYATAKWKCIVDTLIVLHWLKTGMFAEMDLDGPT